MNKLLRFEVRFDDSKDVYYCGQTVAGWVQVESRSPIYATEYYVECLGLSEVHDTASSTPGIQRGLRRQHLGLRESLLSDKQLVQSRGFQFQLPASLPHSVEFAEVGFVRYCCRATVAFSSHAGDVIQATSFFTVVETVDLNSPLVARSCSFEETSTTASERVLHGLLKGDVKMSLMLQKDAYVPGEDVQCTVSVHNSSSMPVRHIELRLLQLAAPATGAGASYGPQKQRVVAQQQLPSDAQTSEKYWSARHRLHIPGVVPSSLQNAHFQHPVSVDYWVQMATTLGVSRVPLRELCVSCPIVVGTVPRLPSGGGARLAAEASFVEVGRRIIPIACVGRDAELNNASSSSSASSTSSNSGASLRQSLTPSRRGQYRSPQLQYTLYCVYYPTISVHSGKSVKSILKTKRHSAGDCLDAVGGDSAASRLQRLRKSPSFSLHETPV